MIVSLIAAMDQNRLIGRDNALPWRLPADLAHFKATTMGKPILMGRKTWESLGRPLPGRPNIVVTRDADYRADGATVVAGIDQALAAAAGYDEVMIIGGASFYQQMLPRADRLYLTRIDAAFEGDAWFPDYAEADWQLTDEAIHAADERNPHDYRFQCFERQPS